MKASSSFLPFTLREGGKQEEDGEVKGKGEECWTEEHCFEQMIPEGPVELRDGDANKL